MSRSSDAIDFLVWWPVLFQLVEFDNILHECIATKRGEAEEETQVTPDGGPARHRARFCRILNWELGLSKLCKARPITCLPLRPRRYYGGVPVTVWFTSSLPELDELRAAIMRASWSRRG